jgi:hypothetical protein
MRKKSLNFARLFGYFLFFVCVCVISNAGAIADDLKYYSENDPKIKQICKSAKQPNSQSKRVESEIIGRWIYFPELSDSLSNIAWHTLVFRKDGGVECIYELKDEKKRVKKVESYKVIHKGSDKKFPGEKPNIIIRRQDQKGKSVIPFIKVSVDYDSRVPMERGKVLKFKDLDGKRHCFIKQKKYKK